MRHSVTCVTSVILVTLSVLYALVVLDFLDVSGLGVFCFDSTERLLCCVLKLTT